MLSYGLIVGGDSKRCMDDPYADSTYVSLLLHHPNYPNSKLEYKGYGLYLLGTLTDTCNYYDLEYGNVVYKFPYQKLLKFLVKHLDADLFEDPDMANFTCDDIWKHQRERIDRRLYQSILVDNRLEMVETTIYIESVRIDLSDVNIDEKTLATIYDEDLQNIYPIWAVALDIEFDEEREKVMKEYHGDSKGHLRKCIKNVKVLEISPISIVLSMINNILDEEEKKNLESHSRDLIELKCKYLFDED